MGPIDLGWPALVGAGALVMLNGALSVWLQLGVERKLLIAVARSTVQLLCLGLVLAPVFAWGSPWPVLALVVVMVLVAGASGVATTHRRFRGIGLAGVIAMAAGAVPTTLIATGLLIGVRPFWAPQYLIPLLGMILGNALTGVSLGLDRALARLDEGRAEVELLLAFGATRAEATRHVVRDAVRTGLVPILNKMAVVGIVTIPGMMTGQILGGSSPLVAAKYQLLILFLIAAAVGLASLGATLWAVRACFDDVDRLRPERIRVIER